MKSLGQLEDRDLKTMHIGTPTSDRNHQTFVQLAATRDGEMLEKRSLCSRHPQSDPETMSKVPDLEWPTWIFTASPTRLKLLSYVRMLK